MKKLFRWAIVVFISAALYVIIFKDSALISNSLLNKEQLICAENALTSYETVTDSEGSQFVFRQTTTLEIDESDVPTPQTEEELIQLVRDMYKQTSEDSEIIFVGEATADYEQSGEPVLSGEISEEEIQCQP